MMLDRDCPALELAMGHCEKWQIGDDRRGWLRLSILRVQLAVLRKDGIDAKSQTIDPET